MKEKTPLSVKLEPEVHERLEQCATKTKVKKYALAIMAIEAAVEAIEKNGYRIAVPIQFDVTHVVVKRANYPEHSPQHVAMNEPSSGSGNPGKQTEGDTTYAKKKSVDLIKKKAGP